MHIRNLITFWITAALLPVIVRAADPVSYVNPFIGTSNMPQWLHVCHTVQRHGLS